LVGVGTGVTVANVGAVVSITISLLAHNDHAAHGLARVSIALLFTRSLIILQPLNTNAHVLA